MSVRSSLPYSTQDLFPQVKPHGSPSRGGGGSTAGGSIAGGSYTGTAGGSSFAGGAHANYTGSSYSGNPATNAARKMLKRLFKPTTLDFETAIWEIFHLIINPKKMYRSHYYYKQQTTNGGKFSYTRDDPSFLILLTVFLCISAIAWGIAYSPTVIDIVRLILYMVVVDFYLTGMVIATVSWFLTNRLYNSDFLRNNPFTRGGLATRASGSNGYIEWGFCFDIHCNSFLIIWCLLYMLQFLLLPLLRIKGSIISLLLGNTLYFASIGYYFVMSLYGFSSLPGQRNGTDPVGSLQTVVLAGVLPLLGIAWLITVCFGFNVADAMVDTYFN
ncbi:UNC-50-domain-containing protein [Suhomyces tanzawaensis NRRL Y-17324]|uniref:UNC-50-domain-containing protein n=1 Tax=Suhomyces tanzawaensis NRRL Y-17324 TaxID=984487 RepID=A0A1E4SEI9_9ASCO|nr:UNC-50-domain-containing protein [Suhomyces tanzawaensis NRRL Y-17324]ODV77876.1 UNC-50-domain-containing protein [Suhomyces tanzawaensis NRRL Y-17324]